MLRSLLFALLQLKVHFKMKVMSWIKSQFFSCCRCSTGKSMSTAPHPEKKIKDKHKNTFLTGEPTASVTSVFWCAIEFHQECPHQVSFLLTQM